MLKRTQVIPYPNSELFFCLFIYIYLYIPCSADALSIVLFSLYIYIYSLNKEEQCYTSNYVETFWLRLLVDGHIIFTGTYKSISRTNEVTHFYDTWRIKIRHLSRSNHFSNLTIAYSYLHWIYDIMLDVGDFGLARAYKLTDRFVSR